MKNFRKYQYIDRLNKKSGEGIALYDKDSFKTKKIITADNRLDTQFKVAVISEDGQYVLFEKVIRDSKEYITNRKYIVYILLFVFPLKHYLKCSLAAINIIFLWIGCYDVSCLFYSFFFFF